MLSTGLNLLITSVSTDFTRPQLCGIYADTDKLVATDGHRMAVMDFATDDKAGKLLEANAFEKGLFAEIKDAGQYPNWKQFIPDLGKYNRYSVTIPNQLSQFKSKKQDETRVYCYIDDGRLITSLDIIKSLDALPKFSVNGAYLKALAGQVIDLYFLDSSSPIVFKNDAQGFTYVVMPMRF